MPDRMELLSWGIWVQAILVSVLSGQVAFGLLLWGDVPHSVER
jgi:hypothetical protein